MSKVLDIKTPRWFVPLLEREGIRYRGAHGGRGSGKSHAFAELMIDRCVEKKMKCVCLREIQKSLQFSVKMLLEIKIESLKVGHLFEVMNDRIKGKNGSLILFQGMQNHTADSIKSLEDFDIAWIEEAQNMSQRSLDILRPTIRKPDSEIWATWNPFKADDPIEFLRNSPPPGTLVVPVNYVDNPWFPDVLTKEADYDRGRDIDKYNHVWLGKHDESSESRIFKNWSVEEFDAPADTIFKFGADFGYAIDPSVLIRCYIVGRRLFIDYEAHQYQCEILNLPQLFGTVPDSDLYPIVADSSRPETISHLKNNGYPKTYGSTKGRGSVKEGIEWLKSYDIVVHPRCENTISELTNYKYKVDPHTLKVTGIIKDENNHVIDALRYACEGARRMTKKEIKLDPIQGKRNHW